MYGFFGLWSDLRGILVNYAKIGDGGVMMVSTMFQDSRGSQLGVFLDSLLRTFAVSPIYEELHQCIH